MAPQFGKDERNFLMMEFHKRKGTRDFLPGLIQDFQAQFPGTRAPPPKTIRAIYKKQVAKGTVLNCNSVSSPGDTHSGRRRTTRTDQNKQAVKALMDRDAPKPIGDPNFSPVSTCRINALNIDKSTWWRLKGDLKYHPYKAIRRHQLQP